jgi:uncharacterized membrane protein YfcA
VIEPWLYPLLTGVAFVAGFIDAIAGGGGLIIMPALLVSGVPPLQALGTNKLQSMCGTFVAMRNYGAKGLIDWQPNLATALIVFAGSAGGAILVQYVDARTLALVIPLLLLANAVYILVSPRMSDEDAHQRVSAAGYAPVGGAIGLYDGFFGPGTGSFFTSSLVALRGYGLTRATALCKFFNWTSNVAAVLLFAIGGKVLWLLGASMAVGAMAGGWLGSHTAMRFGAKLIRPLLITASVAMTARLLWGYFTV